MNEPAQHPSKKMPVVFIGHGSPMNAVQDNAYTRALRSLAALLPRPEAILVVSAHWLTTGAHVTCRPTPEQIFDFHGFPDELYSVRYLPPTAPDLASSVVELGRHLPIACDHSRGTDHAAWAVLMHLYPEADIPVIELSLDLREPPAVHAAIARDLAPLRARGVLILASGNIIHNLREMDWQNADAPVRDWAREFDEQVKAALVAGDEHALHNYTGFGPHARRAVPTPDHYLPMIYAAALREPGDRLDWVYEGYQNASISMRSFIVHGAAR